MSAGPGPVEEGSSRDQTGEAHGQPCGEQTTWGLLPLGAPLHHRPCRLRALSLRRRKGYAMCRGWQHCGRTVGGAFMWRTEVLGGRMVQALPLAMLLGLVLVQNSWW